MKCPPCTLNCEQGRRCPARRRETRDPPMWVVLLSAVVLVLLAWAGTGFAEYVKAKAQHDAAWARQIEGMK